MNIVIDDAIYKLQAHGGISTLWRSVLPLLPDCLPGHTFNALLPVDVFISTYYRPAPRGAKSIAFVYDCIHEHYPHVYAGHPDMLARRRVTAEADAIIAISEATKADIQRFSGRSDVTAAYPATSLKRATSEQNIAVREAYGLKWNRPYVLVVGRRGGYKNVTALYQAWAHFSRHDCTLLCVGGEDPAPYEHVFGKHFDWRQIQVHSDETLEALYSGAEMLVYPSQIEGFGIPVLEALACGCPVVCGTHPALKEAGGTAPFYCNVFKPFSIAEAMNEALNPGTALEQVMWGYAHARRFSWRQMAETIAGTIREVMGEAKELV